MYEIGWRSTDKNTLRTHTHPIKLHHFEKDFRQFEEIIGKVAAFQQAT